MPLTSVYLKSLCDSSQTYFKGATYYNEHRVRISSDKLTPSGLRTVNALVRGSGGIQYQTEITLTADGNALATQECSCPAYTSYYGVCKHIVALALNTALSHPQKPAAIQTDQAALQMLRQYAQRTMLSDVPPTTGIKLVPTLDIHGRVPSVSFKVGLDRMYVIKDLSLFVQAVKVGENRSYGKNLSFTHCMSAFDEESAAIAQFLITYYDVNNYMYADGYYYGSGDRYRSMYLPPFMLDPFFTLLEGCSIAIETARKTDNYTVRTENPRLRLHIDRNANGSYVVRIPKSFYTLTGDARVYLAMEQVIYRCDPAFSNATQGLFKSLSQVSERQLTIAESDMPMLAATLLPLLNPHLHIVSNSDLADFQPPELRSKVYFDMPAPELVTARLEHHYGEASHKGFQPKDMRTSLDLRGETRLEHLMLQFCKDESVPGEVIIREDEKALYELADHGVSEISQLAEVFATDAFKSMRVKPPAAVSVGVRVDSDLLRLTFDVQGMDLAELEQVLSSYRMAKKYHRLRDGSFLNLEDSSLSEFSQLAQGLDLSAKEIMSGELDIPKYRALHLDALLRQSERMQYDRDGAFKQMIRDVRDVSDADFKIPQSLRHVLRNYQRTGYRWLRTIGAYGFGGILADDMGLGKTLQVIALLLAQKEERTEHAISMVVCPSSLVLNWESEVRKFAPDLLAIPVAGAAPYREELIKGADGSADLFITSYDSLKRDVDLYATFSFAYVVADEAQYMKNQNTQNAKAVKTLRSTARLALTGTPVENSLAEVWSIFDFLMPGYLHHYAKFRKNFETPIVKQNDDVAAKSLRQMVSPFILRRMKKDVLKELPDKIETVLYAELEDEQKKLYLANAAEARKELAAGLGNSGNDKLQILALLTRLRQICCDPALIYENYQSGSAKLELCMELLQSCIESGHRVLLFSQFTSMLRRIAARLDGVQTPYFTITGETKVSQRLDMVNVFNEGDTPIFLISLKAGGTGLNLTGADVVIHYDPWWNNSAQNQASDRAHRIGQTKTVQVYKLIAKNTLEERILEMQKNKSDLADMIVKEGDGAFARMSKTEILALFE